MAQAASVRPSAAPTRAEQIAAAIDKVGFEAPSLLAANRLRCMNGSEAASVIDYKKLDGSVIRLNPVDICLARQELSDRDDRVVPSSYDLSSGLYSPYVNFMMNRGGVGTVKEAQFALAKFNEAVAKLKTGEWKEPANRVVQFSIGEGIRPLTLAPGAAFDVGFVTAVTAVRAGVENAAPPKLDSETIRQRALACIGNQTTVSNAECYDLGVENAKRFLTTTPIVRTRNVGKN